MRRNGAGVRRTRGTSDGYQGKERGKEKKKRKKEWWIHRYHFA